MKAIKVKELVEKLLRLDKDDSTIDIDYHSVTREVAIVVDSNLIPLGVKI